MSSFYIAMHAPNGTCKVKIEGADMENFRVAGGNPDNWKKVEAGKGHVLASNTNAEEHLHLVCDLVFHPLSSGSIAISVEPEGGNNASMWVSLDGNRLGRVHTNPNTGLPSNDVVYKWFGLSFENLKPLDSKYMPTGDKPAEG